MIAEAVLDLHAGTKRMRHKLLAEQYVALTRALDVFPDDRATDCRWPFLLFLM
jgi:hypothetical protein